MRGIIKTVHRVFDNHQVFLKKLSGFLIYSDIRRIFSHQKQHQNIDPSYKTGLDFVCVCVCVCFFDGKTYLTAKFEAVSEVWGKFGWESCRFIPEKIQWS